MCFGATDENTDGVRLKFSCSLVESEFYLEVQEKDYAALISWHNTPFFIGAEQYAKNGFKITDVPREMHRLIDRVELILRHSFLEIRY